MVVILIIAVLAAITAAGAFQVMSGRRSANTDITVKKVEDALLKQWQKVIDEASKEPIPDVYLNQQVDASGQLASWGILDMAGGDLKRARVIWIKLRLKQEFPQNLMEVLYPNGPQVGRRGPGNRFVTYLPQFTLPQLPPKATYAHALRNAQAVNSPGTVPSENSAMLLLALTQGRTGRDFNPDDLGAGSLGDCILDRPVWPPPPVSPPFFPAARVTMKQIVDAWNNPVVFWRWPVGNPEIQGSNPAVGGSLSEKFRDPVDPEGLLVHPGWNNWPNYSSYQGVWAFEMLFHSVHIGTNVPFYLPGSQPRAYYSSPVVVSAGKNGFLGIQGPVVPPPPSSPAPPGWPPPISLLPDPMAPDGSGAANDNIYSTRLRLGARGD
jgi:hypothetical protein